MVLSSIILYLYSLPCQFAAIGPKGETIKEIARLAKQDLMNTFRREMLLYLRVNYKWCRVISLILRVDYNWYVYLKVNYKWFRKIILNYKWCSEMLPYLRLNYNWFKEIMLNYKWFRDITLYIRKNLIKIETYLKGFQ